MTEIEKMYENANAYKILCRCSYKNLFDYSIDYGQDACLYAEDKFRNGCVGCELAEQNVKYYPPFTAEKQLKIVKFMLHKGIYYDTDGDTYWFHYTDEIENATYRPFEEAIAEFINGFWQYLTEKEKEEIRNILNER